MDFSNLITLFLSLVGFAAFVSALINIGKTFGIVKDGDAATWSAGLNLLGLVALLIINAVWPDMDITVIDDQLTGIAAILTTITTYIVQLLSTKAAYAALKGTSVIGTSYSLQESSD
jgi:hypothetical protein